MQLGNSVFRRSSQKGFTILFLHRLCRRTRCCTAQRMWPFDRAIAKLVAQVRSFKTVSVQSKTRHYQRAGIIPAQRTRPIQWPGRMGGTMGQAQLRAIGTPFAGVRGHLSSVQRIPGRRRAVRDAHKQKTGGGRKAIRPIREGSSK
jgi:hypothetical protein